MCSSVALPTAVRLDRTRGDTDGAAGWEDGRLQGDQHLPALQPDQPGAEQGETLRGQGGVNKIYSSEVEAAGGAGGAGGVGDGRGL